MIKNADLWLAGVIGRGASRPPAGTPVEVYFAIADHWEPAWRNADPPLQRERVAAWAAGYRKAVRRHADSRGRPPQHTYFFPCEQYEPGHLDTLAALRAEGLGDVEVHLHHDGDTPEQLRETLLEFTGKIHERHGLLRRDAASGQIVYAFIHGNYALNNAFPDGRHCGVDDETSVLLDTGCYADLSMPSAPSPTQSRTVNSIYYVRPRKRARAHDWGIEAEAGRAAPEGALLAIQGPLALNWRRRKAGLLPRIDNADISAANPPGEERVRLWIDTGVHVRGAPSRIFVKLSTHGLQDRILACFLEQGGLDRLWTALETVCAEGSGLRLHYVTAWEMAGLVHEIEGEARKTTA